MRNSLFRDFDVGSLVYTANKNVFMQQCSEELKRGSPPSSCSVWRVGEGPGGGRSGWRHTWTRFIPGAVWLGWSSSRHVYFTTHRKLGGKKHTKWFMFFDLAQETAPFSCDALPVLCEKVFSSRPTRLASGWLPVPLVDVHGRSASPAPFRESFFLE